MLERGARSPRINNLFTTVCSEHQNRKLIYFDTLMSKECLNIKFMRAPKSLTNRRVMLERGARSPRINNLFTTVCSEHQNRKLIYFDAVMSKECLNIKFMRAPKSLTNRRVMLERGARSPRINNLFTTVSSEHQNRKLIYFDTLMSKECLNIKFMRAPKSLTNRRVMLELGARSPRINKLFTTV